MDKKVLKYWPLDVHHLLRDSRSAFKERTPSVNVIKLFSFVFVGSFSNQKNVCNQWIFHVGYTGSHLNNEVKQHRAWIILGWETLQGISGSAGTTPPPCGQSTVLPDSLCLNQVIETRFDFDKKM